MHAIYSTLRLQGRIGSHECMLFIILCPPRDGSDRQGSDDCMLFTTLWAPREISEAKEATNACYLKHFGPPGKYRKRRIHAIYTPCHPRNKSDRKGSDECMLFMTLWVLREVSDQGSDECMLFTIRWALKEVSGATIVCYLQHVGPPGRYRRPRLHAIYETLGPQGGIGSWALTRTAPG